MAKYKVTIDERATYSIEITVPTAKRAQEIAITRLDEHDSRPFTKNSDARTVSVEAVKPVKPKTAEPVPQSFTPDEKTIMNRFLTGVNMLLEHGSMSVSEMSTLFAVALNEHHGVDFYARQLNVPQSTMSVHLKNLGEKHRSRADAPDLIGSRVALDDNRRKEIFLTDKGRHLVNKLRELLPDT